MARLSDLPVLSAPAGRSLSLLLFLYSPMVPPPHQRLCLFRLALLALVWARSLFQVSVSFRGERRERAEDGRQIVLSFLGSIRNKKRREDILRPEITVLAGNPAGYCSFFINIYLVTLRFEASVEYFVMFGGITVSC